MRNPSASPRRSVAPLPGPRRERALPGRLRRGAPALLLAALAGLAGCTSQAWYEGAQVGAEVRCQEGPPAAYDDCMARQNQQRYEDYRREREAVKQAP